LSDIKSYEVPCCHKELVLTIILGTKKEVKNANQLLKEIFRKTFVKEVKKGKMSTLEITHNCLS
jgi:hypothetical protein